MTDKEIIREQANIDISNLRMAQEQGIITEFGKGKLEALEGIVDFIDSMQEEPVSKDLEEAAVEAFKHIVDSDKNSFLEIFKAGAQWQREQEIKYKHRTFLQGEKSVANYILKMIDNGWHINAIYTVCKDKLKED